MFEKKNSNATLTAWEGTLPMSHLYTAGLAGERFFSTLRDRGTIEGTSCAACRQVYVPGRHYCERCFAKLDDWVEVGPEGTVQAWTVCREDLDGRPQAPVVMALILLDGATTPLAHRLDVAPDRVSAGLRVKAVLEPKPKRVGSLLDIRHFAA